MSPIKLGAKMAAPNHVGSVGEIPSLDGLRAISVLIVVLSHSGLGYVVPGGLGVTVFFFLSGFLITTLLRRELAVRGVINFRNFFIRRALRLAPPLFLMLIISYALVFMNLIPGEIHWQSIAAQILYFANYCALFFDCSSRIPAGTGVLWSLAVEEHFYLVYPFLFVWLVKACSFRQAALFFVWVCVFVLAWRVYLATGSGFSFERVYYATDTRIDSILFGCILALFVEVPGSGKPVGLDFLRGKYVGCIFIGFLVLLLSLALRSTLMKETVRYSIQGVALMSIFYGATRLSEGRVYFVLNCPLMKKIGVYSYSIYLIHHVLVRLFEVNFPHGGVGEKIIFTIVFSFIFAQVVEVFWESKMRSVRRRFH
jgi:peptidoglycan/LPS O-acetylase OafA/YrhL